MKTETFNLGNITELHISISIRQYLVFGAVDMWMLLIVIIMKRFQLSSPKARISTEVHMRMVKASTTQPESLPMHVTLTS